MLMKLNETLERNLKAFYVNIYEFVIILHLRCIHFYFMKFPLDYDKFTILSKGRNLVTIRTHSRANVTDKPTHSFGCISPVSQTS